MGRSLLSVAGFIFSSNLKVVVDSARSHLACNCLSEFLARCLHLNPLKDNFHFHPGLKEVGTLRQAKDKSLSAHDLKLRANEDY